MRIIFCDWLHWVFPKNDNSFVRLFRANNIEFKYIEPRVLHRNSRTVEASHKHKLPDPYYRGFNLLNMIKVEMVKELNWYKWDKDVENKYVLRLMGIIDWLYIVFEREKPSHILIEGGLTYFSRACAEVARELGIQIITTENSFIKGKIFIDFNTGFVCNRHQFARSSQDWIETRYLTKAREKEVDDIIASVFNNLKYPSKTVRSLPSLPFEKTLVVPLQVCGDQVCVYDSKYNNEQFVKEILWLAREKFADWNVILRCHPVEEKWKKTAFTGDWVEKQVLPSNVKLVRGSLESVSTQELLQKADLVMVNNSQAGLEACLMNKPVIVFGDAFYGNKGFTLQYKRTHNWESIKLDPNAICNISTMKLWFLYFYKWLYNFEFTDIDKKRVLQNLGVDK